MKKTSITISFDAEKLSAIQTYMGKKDAELEPELEAFLQKQYDKFVPPMVREYIESREAPEVSAPARPPRPRSTPKDAGPDNPSF